MEPNPGDADANGHPAGAIEKIADPPPARWGTGNRISSESQPAIAAAPVQFGAGSTQERQAETIETEKKKPVPKEKGGEDGADQSKEQAGQGNQKNEKDEKEPQRPPFYKRLVPMAILIGVVLILIIGGSIYWLHARQFEGTDDAFIEAHVTGIGPKVAALVQEVNIDDNDLVHTGQVLVQLDPRDFQVALRQAKANEASIRGQLSSANSNLQVASANVLEAQAELTVAQVNFENADRNFKRYQALDARATSKQQLDNVAAEERGNEAQVTQAKAKVTQMQAQVASAQSQVETAQANVDRAVADVEQANLNLSYCTIISPQDGYITRKSVEPGSYVSVGQVLFSIVPTHVWIVANFKETQLDLMRPNQPVDIHVDAYPDITFHGKVDSIQAGTGSSFSLLPPENATGNYVKVVQRVPVKIAFDDAAAQDRDHVLGVGMSVEPKVKVR